MDTDAGSQRSLSGTASPVPAEKTETPSRASHTGLSPASGAEGVEAAPAAAAAETSIDRRQRRGKRARDPDTSTRRGRGARGAEAGRWAPENVMAVAMARRPRRGRAEARAKTMDPRRARQAGEQRGAISSCCFFEWLRPDHLTLYLGRASGFRARAVRVD